MNNIPKLPTKLPAEFHTFFWDVDAKKVNPATYPHYVINRLLDKGDLVTSRWVLHNFPRNIIVETFKTSRDVSFKTATFWANYLQIPKEEIKCMQEPYRTLRRLHWPS